MALVPCDLRKSKNFANRAIPGVFIGLAEEGRVPSWKCVKHFRTVKFNENDLIRTGMESAHHEFHLQYEQLFRPKINQIAKVNMSRILGKFQQLDEDAIPRSYSELKNFSPDIATPWKKANRKEIDPLMQVGDLRINSKWEAKGKIIPLAELFTIKTDNITQKKKFKVRVCVRGDLVHEKQATYAPVLTDETIKLTLLLFGTGVTLTGLQADMSTAFLHERDSVKHFYCQPKGIYEHDECWAEYCAIYGRPKSPRDWRNHFDVFLK